MFPTPKLSHWPEYLFIFLVMVCPSVVATWIAEDCVLSMVAYFVGTMFAGLVLWAGLIWLSVRLLP